jgi:16S rRNA (adenine1518-N6/adenine1519-N6)-dimethyltransferase
MPAKLGQHFLYDPKIAARIADSAEIGADDTVLEIGPGKGILTKELSERAKQIIAVELDEKLALALEGKFPNVMIVRGDILKIEWPEFDKIVSNIPFEISSPLLTRIFEHRKPATLMVQKEFAVRLLAKPGNRDYSRLSVACGYHCDAKKLFDLRPGAFRPAPKVSATVVKLVPKEPPFEADEKFWGTVNVLFQHRKKTVKAALKGRDTGRIPETLLKKRAFQCGLEDLKKISDAL